MIGATTTHPKVRLPGAGGAPEIAASCGEVVVIVAPDHAHVRRAGRLRHLVGYGSGPGDRERSACAAAARVRVITDLGVLEPDAETCELTLTALHPGVDVEQVRAATGWELRVADDAATSPEPTDEELAALRELEASVAPRERRGVHPRRGAHAVRPLRRRAGRRAARRPRRARRARAARARARPRPGADRRRRLRRRQRRRRGQPQRRAHGGAARRAADERARRDRQPPVRLAPGRRDAGEPRDRDRRRLADASSAASSR